MNRPENYSLFPLFFTRKTAGFRAKLARFFTAKATAFQNYRDLSRQGALTLFGEALRRGGYCGPLAAGANLAYLNPFGYRHELGQRLELLSVYAEGEAGGSALSHLRLALLTALLLQSYGLLLTATRPVTAIFAFLGYLLLLLPPFFALDGDYLGVIHLLVYPGAILIFFAFASLTTDQRGS